MKYEGIYACGCAGIVDVIGPTKDRAWKVERAFSYACPKCREERKREERARELEKAQEQAAEMEFPALCGTPRQVDWGIVLRARFVSRFMDIENINKEVNFSTTLPPMPADEYQQMLEIGIKKHTHSRFWIEGSWDSLLHTFFKEYEKEINTPQYVKDEVAAEKMKLTVAPKETRKPGVVILQSNSNNEKQLEVVYVKDRDFIDIVKGCNYKWSGSAWYRSITEFTGAIDDRAAEIGNKLLNAGFVVQFMNTAQKEASISGSYERECTKWIQNGSGNNVSISWKGRNDTLYNAARRLPGARYRDGAVQVDAMHYKQILDFAETMEFKLSENAIARIETQKLIEDQYMHANVASVASQEKGDAALLEKRLMASVTIIDDLRDE